MSTISGAYGGQSSLADILQSALAPLSSQANSSSDTGTSGQDGSATNVTLSDKAKAILAQAQKDQVVANRLQAFADALRAGNKAGADSTDNKGSADSAGDTAANANDGTPSIGNFVGQDGTIYGVIVTPTEPGSAVATAVPIVDPTIGFSSQLHAGGFTISASADASTGTYDMTIDGPDGFHWSDQKLDSAPSLGNTTGEVPTGGLIVSGAGPGNIETIKFSENSAAAATVTASSDAGSVSATAASARTLSATVSIDLSTGTIKINGSSATATSQSATLNLSV